MSEPTPPAAPADATAASTDAVGTLVDANLERLIHEEPSYDGEGYSREILAGLVTEYQDKHQANLKSLAELSKAHDSLASEMTKDLTEQKNAWECLKDIFTFHQVGSSFRGLLERIPLLRDTVPDRSINELLEEKIEVAQRRIQEVGNYLDRMTQQVADLQTDIGRLNKKMIVAATNEERAARVVLDLEAELAKITEVLGALDEKSANARELQSRRDAIKQAIWRHGAKLRLFSNAEDRIASIVKMNNNFLEILTNLHANMQTLFDSGSDVLGELQGNLASLASAAKAADLTLEMQKAMESLKTSVNKVAILASETSLYLTQNVERLTSEMKVYDDETAKLVESNLAAEREIKEQRIDETIELARTEYGHFKEARGEKG